MCKNKDCIKQLLWLLALTIPWGLGGFVVHTAFSLSLGIIVYWAAGLLVPLIFYLVQKKGWGSELGGLRGAVHGLVWISLVIVEMVVFWNYLPSIDRIWKASPVPAAAASFLVLSFFVILAFFLDRWISLIYVRLKEKNTLAARWLGSAFFSGLIPGTAMISFLGLYYAGGMRLDPFTASFFLMEIFGFVFYGKILLAMMTFGVFLFLSLEGPRGERAVTSVFSAIFWLFLLFIPVVVSSRITGSGLWRAYLDPSYLSVFPYLSDLWLTGLALMGARRLTAWIFR
ncbi:hypothetical protein [Dialister succinatiphilus]|jgi:hypothetical protein|uniref:hypothetical protein n=1 Tax=Dialister succinatiphilus TaxID=487173 RepID=UPI0023536F8C|nr:hypothetical protein [Dialister succinatiphilus]